MWNLVRPGIGLMPERSRIFALRWAMAKVTDFECADELGFRVLCDAFGNNVAFKCPNCARPVLAILRANQRGSDPHNPSVFRRSGNVYWLIADVGRRVLALKMGDSG